MKLKEAREQQGLSVRKFCAEADISTRTLQDVEREENPRTMRRETAIKVAPVLARHGIDPTDVQEVSEALGIGPRYERPNQDMSRLYSDEDLKGHITDRLAVLIERRIWALREELEAEINSLIEQEVERRVAERIGSQEVQRK